MRERDTHTHRDTHTQAHTHTHRHTHLLDPRMLEDVCKLADLGVQLRVRHLYSTHTHTHSGKGKKEQVKPRQETATSKQSSHCCVVCLSLAVKRTP